MTSNYFIYYREALCKWLNILWAWRPGPLAKGTAAITLGMGLRTITQTVVFLIVARVLGVADYGAYSAILALSTAFACFSGSGSQALLVRDVSRDMHKFSVAWGVTLSSIVLGSPILFAIYLSFTWALLPAVIPLHVIAFIGLADLVISPVGLAAINAFQAHERLGRVAYLSLVPVLPRLAGALALIPIAIFLPDTTRLTAWAILYSVTSVAASFVALKIVGKDLGYPIKPAWCHVRQALRDGWPFAVGNASVKIYADIDKAMLARLATMETAGAYSAGHRVADVATVPVLSFITAAMPRFFRTGEIGVQAALAFTYRIVPIPLAYSILAGLGLYLSAGILPFFLGAGFIDAVPILQWLAWIPIISLPRLFLQSLLVGSDQQNSAVKILAGGSLLNIALNLWLIPLWSWQGAVTATYAAEIAMALGMCAFAFLPQAKRNLPLPEK